MSDTIYIIGCGGHARSIADILATVSQSRMIFIDPKAREQETIFGFPVLAQHSFQAVDQVFIALGSNADRLAFHKAHPALQYISIISASAHIGLEASVQEGIFIGYNAHVGPQAVIGKHSIINNGAIVEHEVTVGDYCHIGPNATISGRTKIGDSVFIGVGATVIDNISICSDVIIGAGSTVIRSITEPGTYVGSPAKKIK